MIAQIEKALRQAVLDAVDISDQYISVPNIKFTPPVSDLWIRFTFLPNTPAVASLGDCGKDDFDGLVQVDVFVPT